MKRLFLGVFCWCLVAGNVWADKNAEFVRIECNQDLGVFTISNHKIYGKIISNYFDKMKPSYKYESVSKGNKNAQAEVVLLSNYTWEENKPFQYQCKINDNQVYDAKIVYSHRTECDEEGNFYKVDVSEGTYDGENNFNVTKDVLKQVSFGCDKLTFIQFTAEGGNDGVRIELTQGTDSTFFFSNDVEESLTDEAIEQEKQQENEFAAELELYSKGGEQ